MLREDHQAPRECLLPPIPELREAADLLSEAADGLLVGDEELVRDRIQRADMPVVHDWASRIMGSVDHDIHRYRRIEGQADAVLPLEKIPERMPGRAIATAIYARDGYHCRFCGSRVVLPIARFAIAAKLPGAIRWGDKNREQHAAFFALTATIDHLVPHAKGGGNEPENLLTTCQACNFGRGVWLIAEVGLMDPRTRPPIVDSWDGLMRLATSKPRKAGQARAATTALTAANDVATPSAVADVSNKQAAWFSSLDHALGTSSARLLTFLRDCEPLEVTWKLEKVLLVSMNARGRTLNVFGIEPDGEMEIPWSIGEEKDRFRGFAETLAAAIPGAVSYETPKMWRVGKGGGRLNILDILNATDVVLEALRKLRETLEN
ncbi:MULTISPECIES: HNH endonuclease [unclassified Inquilinus]|uniref:HNH endonuclease n=1 Tax=unclassified Inquilinus TaxID=2645927 RepID=UPI003F91D584